jgi:hypothetical protein
MSTAEVIKIISEYIGGKVIAHQTFDAVLGQVFVHLSARSKRFRVGYAV